MSGDPNPVYEELEQLKSDVEGDLPDVKEQLDSIAERMGDGSVWFGTQADNFSADLDGEKDQLRNRADDLPGDIQEKMDSTPETLPEGDEPS